VGRQVGGEIGGGDRPGQFSRQAGTDRIDAGKRLIRNRHDKGPNERRGCRPVRIGIPAKGSCQLHECYLTASATFCRFFGRYRFFFRLVFTFACSGVFFLAFFSAHGTVFVPASATACGLLHFAGAPGVRFGASAAAGCLRTRHVDAAGADQAGNTQPSEQLFQILAVHGTLLVRMMMKSGLNR